MLMIREALARVRRQDEAATAVEYAVMVALIAAVIIAAVVVLGQNASSAFDCAADALPEGSTESC